MIFFFFSCFRLEIGEKNINLKSGNEVFGLWTNDDADRNNLVSCLRKIEPKTFKIQENEKQSVLESSTVDLNLSADIINSQINYEVAQPKILQRNPNPIPFMPMINRQIPNFPPHMNRPMMNPMFYMQPPNAPQNFNRIPPQQPPHVQNFAPPVHHNPYFLPPVHQMNPNISQGGAPLMFPRVTPPMLIPK